MHVLVAPALVGNTDTLCPCNRYACRALFERHKLLYSLQMCAKILDAAGKLNIEEYTFFLRGGVVLDRYE